MRSDENEEITQLRERVDELTNRVDSLCGMVGYIAEFLEDYTHPKRTIGTPFGTHFTSRQFFIVPRPIEADDVYRMIMRVQAELFRCMLPAWLEELGTVTPTEPDFREFIESKRVFYAEHVNDYRQFCIPRRNLQERMEMHHTRLKENTDNLIYTGEIIEFGKVGGQKRFGVPLEHIGWVIENAFTPRKIVPFSDEMNAYDLSSVLENQ